jgi:hypothetical protein
LFLKNKIVQKLPLIKKLNSKLSDTYQSLTKHQKYKIGTRN